MVGIVGIDPERVVVGMDLAVVRLEGLAAVDRRDELERAGKDLVRGEGGRERSQVELGRGDERDHSPMER